MSLANLSKYKLDRETMSNIRGAGYGTVTCEDGTQFSHTASSIESVRDRGDYWCRRHGHGGGATYVWVGEGEFTFPE